MAASKTETLQIENQNSETTNHTRSLDNHNFDSLMNLLLTRLADHENTTLEEFQISAELLQKEHIAKMERGNKAFSKVLTDWKGFCSRKLKAQERKLKNQCAEFQKEGGSDVWQQKIDDLKNSSAKQQEANIRSIQVQIENYEEYFDQIANECSNMAKIFISSIQSYVADQFDAVEDQLRKQNKNSDDLEDILNSFTKAQTFHTHHSNKRCSDEVAKWEKNYYRSPSSREYGTLLRQGYKFVRNLRKTMNKFRKTVELEKLSQTISNKTINEKIHVFYGDDQCEEGNENPKPVVLKDNSRKFQRHGLRQRNINQCSLF